MNFIFKYGPIKAVFALLSIFVLLPMALSEGAENVEKNIEYQSKHMQYLENQYYGESYERCNEAELADFDISLAESIKFNEVAFIGTHNSYRIGSGESYEKLFEAIDVLSFGLISEEGADFSCDTITQQLQVGLRNLEIDIQTIDNKGEISFVVSHQPYLDNLSSCYDLALALKEIKLWSDNNPGHMPVSVIIEPKALTLPIDNMRGFSYDYALCLDELLRQVLGETLLTPADMLGDYKSFYEMRMADDWLSLDKTQGKVLVLLHDCGVTDKYIKSDESIKTQAMFPMLRYGDRNKSYASFIIENDPKRAASRQGETIDKYNLIVRTRADSFLNFSEEKYDLVMQGSSQIISTDYPVRYTQMPYHTFTFDGYMFRLIK